VDPAGAVAFDAYRQSIALARKREKLPPRRWALKKIILDGPKLERWFLKTLINLSYGGTLPIGRNGSGPGLPADELVRVAFGKAVFPERAGLYNVLRLGTSSDSNETLAFAPLIKDSAFIIGGLFGFRGFEHLLMLEPPDFDRMPTGIGIGSADWGGAQLNFHNRKANATVAGHVSSIIETRWARRK
jgi:hypothetical protein